MVVAMSSCFVNRSASMPRLDLQPPDPEDPGPPPGVNAAQARNRQFTVYDKSSCNSSGYNTLSRGYRGSRGSGACFEGCFPHLSHFAGNFRTSHSTVDVRRHPMSATSSRGFWSGISELKHVLTPGDNLKS